jgi:hypothetical protein
MRAIWRILLSFFSMLLAVAIFSGILAPISAWPIIFNFTMVFALPVWLINLPFLFLLRNLDPHHKWMVPALGALIGPACLMLWCGILVFRGYGWLALWNGDPEAFGLLPMLIFASLIGLGANAFYMLVLWSFKRYFDSGDPGAPHGDERGANS